MHNISDLISRAQTAIALGSLVLTGGAAAAVIQAQQAPKAPSPPPPVAAPASGVDLRDKASDPYEIQDNTDPRIEKRKQQDKEKRARDEERRARDEDRRARDDEKRARDEQDEVIRLSERMKQGFDARDPARMDDINRIMRQQMEVLERQMQEMHRMLDANKNNLREFNFGPGTNLGGRMRGFTITPGTPGAKHESESIEIRQDQDKVVVVVKSGKDGNEDVERYEANSMEEFKQKYPEIAQKYFGGGGGVFHVGPGVAARTLPPMEWRQPAQPGLPRAHNDPMPQIAFGGAVDEDEDEQFDIERLIGHDNGERLGVTVAPVKSAVADFLGIGHGAGFIVESVTDGSQAEALGLKAKDLVISINGKTIGRDGSVREALASVSPGKTVRLEIVRGAEGKKVLEGTKREKAKADEPRRAQR